MAATGKGFRIFKNPPWRRPGVEPGPIQLNSRRLYILPTRIGLVFATLLLGLLLASANYSVSLGFLFTFLMISLGMTCLIHTHRNLLGIELRPLPVVPIHAGEQAVFRLLASNPGPRMRGALRLGRKGDSQTEADLAARGERALELRLPQPRRGYHRAGPLTLASTWPLGLFRCWTVFALDWGVLVYPRPAADAMPFPLAAGHGKGMARQRRGDEEFVSLRGYRPGDPSSRIAWKNMARGLPPLTKQFADTLGETIWLDWNDAPERETEARISRLARWAIDAERAGHAWGLSLPRTSLPPGRGDAHLKRTLEALARYGED